MIHSRLLRVSELTISTWIDRRIWVNTFCFYWAVSFFVMRFILLTVMQVLFLCFGSRSVFFLLFGYLS
jgi:hypothetical protein